MSVDMREIFAFLNNLCTKRVTEIHCLNTGNTPCLMHRIKKRAIDSRSLMACRLQFTLENIINQQPLLTLKESTFLLC